MNFHLPAGNFCFKNLHFRFSIVIFSNSPANKSSTNSSNFSDYQIFPCQFAATIFKILFKRSYPGFFIKERFLNFYDIHSKVSYLKWAVTVNIWRRSGLKSSLTSLFATKIGKFIEFFYLFICIGKFYEFSGANTPKH